MHCHWTRWEGGLPLLTAEICGSMRPALWTTCHISWNTTIQISANTRKRHAAVSFDQAAMEWMTRLHLSFLFCPNLNFRFSECLKRFWNFESESEMLPKLWVSHSELLFGAATLRLPVGAESSSKCIPEWRTCEGAVQTVRGQRLPAQALVMETPEKQPYVIED